MSIHSYRRPEIATSYLLGSDGELTGASASAPQSTVDVPTRWPFWQAGMSLSEDSGSV